MILAADMREQFRQWVLDQPGATDPQWVENWMAIYDADEADSEARLIAQIETLLEHGVEGVEDMSPMHVFFAILKLEHEGVIPKPGEDE